MGSQALVVSRGRSDCEILSNGPTFLSKSPNVVVTSQFSRPPDDTMGDDIPIVDLSLDTSVLASVIRDACVRHGFFYLTNHGVPNCTIEEMHASSKQFFDLSLHEKRTVCASSDPNNRGWTPLGEETLDPGNQTQGDTKEGYYVGREAAPHEVGLPLRGPNHWPDEQLLKINFKQPMMAYHAALTELCQKLMPVFAEALGLDKHFFDDKFQLPSAFLRPLKYSNKKSSPSDGVLGAGAHSDYGTYFPFTTFRLPDCPYSYQKGLLPLITLTVYSYTLRETDTFFLTIRSPHRALDGRHAGSGDSQGRQ
jgi:hypothetical protein